MPILKLVTLTKSMTYKHSVKFFKEIDQCHYQLQWQYMNIMQHIISGPVGLTLGISFASGSLLQSRSKTRSSQKTRKSRSRSSWRSADEHKFQCQIGSTAHAHN